MKLDRLMVKQGDDFPRLYFQLYDLATGDPIDLQTVGYVVLVKFREQNEDNVLMEVASTILVDNLGICYMDWTATALDQEDGSYEVEFFLSKSSSSGTITGATQASPLVITCVGHGLVDDDEVLITDVGGMTEINDIPFLVVKIDDDTFSLTTQDGTAVDGSAYTAYTTGGTWTKYSQIQTALHTLPVRLKEDF